MSINSDVVTGAFVASVVVISTVVCGEVATVVTNTGGSVLNDSGMSTNKAT